MKRFKTIFGLLALSLVFAIGAMAGPSGPGGGVPQAPPPEQPAPVDGGALLLLAGAAAYAYRKMKNKKGENAEDNEDVL